MAYIGNTSTTQSFTQGTDYFNGNGSTVAFTLSRPVVSVNDIEVVVNNVVQNPSSAYTVSGSTLTFTPDAPSTGTNNIYVRYLTTTQLTTTPSQGSVTPLSLSSGGPTWISGGTVFATAGFDGLTTTSGGFGLRATADTANTYASLQFTNYARAADWGYIRAYSQGVMGIIGSVSAPSTIALGIGNSAPTKALDVTGTARVGTAGSSAVFIGNNGRALAFNRDVDTGTIVNSGEFAYQFNHTPSSTNTSDRLDLQIYNGAGVGVTTTALTINGAANIGIGTTPGATPLNVGGSGITSTAIYTTGQSSLGSTAAVRAVNIGVNETSWTSSVTSIFWNISDPTGSNGANYSVNVRGLGSNGSAGTNLAGFGIAAPFSANSKSFKIPHPIPSMSESHHLVHMSVESPQADLIYRGTVNLVNGAAAINIDTASNMTDGTFVLLCGDVQCFTTNESDWTPIKGKVTGNILNITAQDPTSTAEISWMVIGQRIDSTFLESNVTDDEGNVIVEPLNTEKALGALEPYQPE